MQARRSNDMLETQLNRVQEELKQVANSSKESWDENLQLKRQISELRVEADVMEDQLRRHKAEKESLETEVGIAKRESRSLEGKMEELQVRVLRFVETSCFCFRSNKLRVRTQQDMERTAQSLREQVKQLAQDKARLVDVVDAQKAEVRAPCTD